mmetsp:Transcript_105996/g.330584  ORF Transcript_105996/g.330584 Transcript_105996/m.330584 type:complete len:461 (-) Transcript_105996:31-1413(-)
MVRDAAWEAPYASVQGKVSKCPPSRRGGLSRCVPESSGGSSRAACRFNGLGLLAEVLQDPLDLGVRPAEDHLLRGHPVSQLLLPDQDAVRSDVLRVVDDPVLLLEVSRLLVFDEANGRRLHPELQDNLDAVVLVHLRLRVVLGHLDPGGAVDASAGLLLELLAGANSEACAQDAGQAVLRRAVVGDRPSGVVLLEPTVVARVILALYVDREALPADRELVGLPAAKELAAVVLDPSEVLVEAEVKHVVWVALHADSRGFQRGRESLEEVGVAKPISSRHLTLQAPRPASANLACQLCKVNDALSPHQLQLGLVRARHAPLLQLRVERPVSVELYRLLERVAPPLPRLELELPVGVRVLEEAARRADHFPGDVGGHRQTRRALWVLASLFGEVREDVLSIGGRRRRGLRHRSTAVPCGRAERANSTHKPPARSLTAAFASSAKAGLCLGRGKFWPHAVQMC